MKRSPLPRGSGPVRRTPLRRRRVLKARSARQKALDAVLAVTREERREMAHGRCEGHTPACPPDRHQGVLAHHVRRRKGQPDVHAVEGLRWLCDPGHRWVHDNPASAKALGLLT